MLKTNSNNNQDEKANNPQIQSTEWGYPRQRQRARVLPMIDIAYWYGFGVVLLEYKLWWLNEQKPEMNALKFMQLTTDRIGYEQPLAQEYPSEQTYPISYVTIQPVHSLHFLKSIPAIRFEDSRPVCASAFET